MLLLLCVLGSIALVGLYSTRLSWGPGLIVPAPRPTYSAQPLPEGVDRALEVQRDGVHVRAWVLEPSERVKGTLFVLHGIRDQKSSMLVRGDSYRHQGLRVVLVDSRGHGESSGEYLTYGVEESRDLRALVDALEGDEALDPPLLVMGTSYGAATAVQYAALDRRVASTFAISPFSSLRDVAEAYAHWIAGPVAYLMPDSMLEEVLEEAGRQGAFDPADACPLCAAADLPGELLVAHSRDDERIPFAQGVAVAGAAGARLVAVSGASHNETGGHPAVREAIDEWLSKWARSFARGPTSSERRQVR